MNAIPKIRKGGVNAELTNRQRQILKLLQEGKVNKEIAVELGIGVGTVKQHVVALFKKLNVSNRTMAVSTGIRKYQAEEDSAAMTVDGLLERRPCVVLSAALPDAAESAIVRRLHGTLAALAFDHDALFLARKGNAGDVIFGIQRVTEYDLFKALQTAHAAYKELFEFSHEEAGRLSGGLTAGLAVASMKRFGGWTGEAIASSAIYFARELVQEAGFGKLALGQPAKDLMNSFGAGQGKVIPGKLFFHELETFCWTGERFTYRLVDRSAELGKLYEILKDVETGTGRIVYLEGETGMGKSRLCKEVVDTSLSDGGEVSLYRCQPFGAGEVLTDVLEGGVSCLTENVIERLHMPPKKIPEVVIVDDFHLLAKDKQLSLFAEARNVFPGRMVLFAGRRYEGGKFPIADVEIISLGRLPLEAIEQLVRLAIRERGGELQDRGIKEISGLAAGVPLFAVELAGQDKHDTLGLPLLVIICGRLDSLSLDRKLLRTLAVSKRNLTLDEVASILDEDAESLRTSVDRARASGVLLQNQDDENRISFAHPVLRQAINQLSME